MEDYYWEEVSQVLEEYNILHDTSDYEDTEEGLDAFLGGEIYAE